MALPVMDAVITAARQHFPDGDPILAKVADVISPENIVGGVPIRAIDALLVVDQLSTALELRRGPITF